MEEGCLREEGGLSLISCGFISFHQERFYGWMQTLGKPYKPEGRVLQMEGVQNTLGTACDGGNVTSSLLLCMEVNLLEQTKPQFWNSFTLLIIFIASTMPRHHWEHLFWFQWIWDQIFHTFIRPVEKSGWQKVNSPERLQCLRLGLKINPFFYLWAPNDRIVPKFTKITDL